jgi:hypothetical protein
MIFHCIISGCLCHSTPGRVLNIARCRQKSGPWRFRQHPPRRSRHIAHADSSDNETSLCVSAARSRRWKRLGVAYSVICIAGSGCLALASHMITIPALEDAARVTSVLVFLFLCVLLLYWASYDGRVYVEWHEGRVWLEPRVPPNGAVTGEQMPPGAVKVREKSNL